MAIVGVKTGIIQDTIVDSRTESIFRTEDINGNAVDSNDELAELDASAAVLGRAKPAVAGAAYDLPMATNTLANNTPPPP